MSNEPKFAPPNAKLEVQPKKPLPCPFTPQGILQPSHLQPPPMFGPRGATIPPKHLANYKPQFDFRNKHQSRDPKQRPPFNQHRNNFNRPRFQQNRSNHDGAPIRFATRGNFSNGSPRMQFLARNENHVREFWCEPCDRDFRAAEELAEHRQQHQKCGIDGCKYEGHELMVTKHIQMQHSSGLYEKIKNLSTPEDINKWREERRKRYPTKQNIEIRQQMQEAKQKRGERLEDPKNRFGRKCDRKQPEPKIAAKIFNQPKRKRKRKGKSEVSKTEMVKVTLSTEPKLESFNGALIGFQGTSTMSDYVRPKVEIKKNALSNLLGMYGSDDESDETDDENVKVIEELNNVCQNAETGTDLRIIEVESNISSTYKCETTEAIITDSLEAELSTYCEDEAPEEHAVIREADIGPQSPTTVIVDSVQTCSKNALKRPVTRSENDPKNASKKVKTILDMTKRYRNQNTMLEKLLQKEVRHERNVLLQCVRYVVENNFFQATQAMNHQE